MDPDSLSLAQQSTRVHMRALPRVAGPATLVWLTALAAGLAYVVVLAVQVPHLIGELEWNSSVASGYVMPETLVKTGTGGATVMGSVGDWVPLWFGLLTAHWPLHRQLWGVMPTLLFVASALTVSLSVAMVASRRAAILAALIGLAASSLALAFLISPFSHNVVYPCTALLGAYLIWLARARGRRRAIAIVVPPLLGVVVGVCVASDALLLATGVIPLAITAILAGVRRERRSRIVSLSALTTVAVAIPIAKITSSTMGSLGYSTLPTPIKIAALSELPSRAHLLFEGLKALFNGYLGGPEGPGTLHAPLGIASDVVMVAALLTLILVGVRTTVRLIVSGVRRHASQASSAPLARQLHIVYWTASAASACGAFWIAGEGPVTTHYSYYFTVVFSVAAVVPLLLSGGAFVRTLVCAGATVFFVGGLVGLGSDYLSVYAGIARYAPTITRIARANDARYGYSNWADASGLTWGTHEGVIARPVVECSTTQGTSLCPGFQTFIPSWYSPQPRRTFLLVEANGVDLSSVPAILGKPLASYAFGPMQMYIYPYDIASHFGAGLE